MKKLLALGLAPALFLSPAPASSQTDGRLNTNLVKDGDFETNAHDGWAVSDKEKAGQGYEASPDEGHGTVWGLCGCDSEGRSMAYALTQDVRIADIVDGGADYEVDFSVDVKCENAGEGEQWSAWLSLSEASTEQTGEEDAPTIETREMDYASEFRGGDTRGWRTFRSIMRIPTGADYATVVLTPACDGGDVGECKTATWFDNVSVVVRKVEDGKSNATSRVAAPVATPSTAYDLGGRRIPAGGRGLGVRGGKLTMGK